MRPFLAALALAAAPALAQVPPPENCLPPPYDGAKTETQQELAALVGNVRARLGAFPSLAAVLAGAAAPTICLTAEGAGAAGWHTPEDGRIVLHRSLSAPLRRAVLLHELRHVEQIARGACPAPEMSMQATGQAVLAMEADASAVTALVAWHWAAEGSEATWTALSRWPSQIDITARLADALAAGAAPADAAAAAFAQWYVSDVRRQSYWLSACGAYLDREDADHALPRYGSLEGAFYGRLCVLPDGSGYPCAPPE